MLIQHRAGCAQTTSSLIRLLRFDPALYLQVPEVRQTLLDHPLLFLRIARVSGRSGIALRLGDPGALGNHSAIGRGPVYMGRAIDAKGGQHSGADVLDRAPRADILGREPPAGADEYTVRVMGPDDLKPIPALEGEGCSSG